MPAIDGIFMRDQFFACNSHPKKFLGVGPWLWPVKHENFLLLFYLSRDLLETLCIFIPPLAYNL